MNRPAIVKIYVPLLLIIVAGLLYSCGSQAPATPPAPEKPSRQAEPVTPPETTVPPSSPSSKNVDRVDIVYFHRPQRCTKCICFEKRISYVVNTHFQDKVDSGKVTFQVCNLGDKENAAIAKKYGAVASQLFVNTIKDGIEDIRNVTEIWAWGCTSDEQGFDEAVKNTIEQSLNSIE